MSTFQGSQSPKVTAQAKYPLKSKMIVNRTNGFFKKWAIDSRDTIQLPSVVKKTADQPADLQ